MSDPNATHQEGQNGTPPEGQNNIQQLPTSLEELQVLLQRETDKRVTQALKTAKAKWETEFSEMLKTEKEEAARLAKLSAEQREKELFEKQKADFEKQQAAFRREQMLNSTMIELQKESLPVQFAEYLLSDTAEQVAANITTFKSKWQEALQKAVDDRLKGTTPKGGAKVDTPSSNFFDAITKNKIR
jgi:small-conductance mechanosensitive channel